MFNRSARVLVTSIDSLVALAIAVASVAWANAHRMPMGGLKEFLALRVTVLNASFCIVFAVLWKACLEKLGLQRQSFSELLQPTVRAATGCGVMAGVLALFLAAHRVQGPLWRGVVAFFFCAFGYEMARIVLLSSHLQWRSSELGTVIIVGSGRRAAKAWREVRTRQHRTRRLLGFIDERDPGLMPPDIAGRYLGGLERLPELFLTHVVDEVLIACPMRSCYDIAQKAVALAEAAGVRILCLSDSYDLVHARTLRERAAMFVDLTPKDEELLGAETLKRALDVIVSAIGLVVLAPALLLIAIAIKATSPGPVLFGQERYGYKRRRFRMWKFRSMVANASELMQQLEARNEASGPIFKIRNDPRVTPFGRFLRRTSIDELPQLWNVLLGDMSLVGPRPMTTRDVSHFNNAQFMRRFSVRPGITGMWQINGRGSLNFDQWIHLDFSYIDHWSFGLDLKILARTVPAVLKRSGAA